MLADYTHSSFPNVGSLMASFHVQGGWGQSFVYQNSSTEFFNFDSKAITEEITEIELELCDHKLCPINFNGHNWTIQLTFLT
ncbi:hypothetical protein AMAG_19025 [Allomyces macrogynus ATCC 38327]|uniref:Uncharacterized protein n=1 Tax=Allomyces macrogynus (strain ATCC 38327) TaxID=578462 RepID=A0A0L0SMK1_ALLM3|nr:hypothetical protein AMAG_19025 [Allomyces macrogynus ATCC 38327]|eukprot:KNE63610.1 hypothetical protein AMAG_19025 [Allomyces macrogynus ATCC 38327]